MNSELCQCCQRPGDTLDDMVISTEFRVEILNREVSF